MRKSLLIMVLVLSAFSLQASTYVLENCGCSCPELREKCLELNVGYRRDYLNWKFEDPSLRLLQVAVPVVLGLIGDGSSSSESPKVNIFDVIAGVLDAEICKNSLFQSSWSDLRMINVGGIARAYTCNNMYARFSGNWAYVFEGKYKTSGFYAGESDTLNNLIGSCGFGSSPFCRRVTGNTWDVSGAIGYEISSCDNDFSFIPVLGYAHNEINLHTERNRFSDQSSDFLGFIHLLVNEIDFTNTEVTGFSKARYNSFWTGPYLGFDAFFQPNCNLNLYTSFEYHWGIYHAKSRNSNDLKLTFFGTVDVDGEKEQAFTFDGSSIDSFTAACFNHHAFSRGLFWDVGANYNFCDCWLAGLKFSWMDWRTFKNGRIRAKVDNEINVDVDLTSTNAKPIVGNLLSAGDIFKKDTHLPSVHWNSYRIEFTLGRCF